MGRVGALDGGKSFRAALFSLLALFSLSLVTLVPHAATSAPGSNAQQAQDAYAKLPLSFVPNRGQTDKRVRYYAQGPGYGFFFTDDKAVLSFTKGKRGTALELTLARREPGTRASRPAAAARGRVNYLVGSRAARPTSRPTGTSSTATSGRASTWSSAAQGGKLKYEFHVAPGADPSPTSGSPIAAPTACRSGARATCSIGRRSGRCATRGRAATSASAASGSGREPLRSSARRERLRLHGRAPTTAAGRSSSTRASSTPPTSAERDLDNGAGDRGRRDGNAYVTGYTDSADFPTTSGAFDTTLRRQLDDDAFVTKLNPAGSALVYSTYLGGTRATTRAHGIAVDASGSAYVTGTPTPATSRPPRGRSTRASTAAPTRRLRDEAQPGRLGARLLHLPGRDRQPTTATAIAVDASGSAYVTGHDLSTDFPTTAGAFDTSFNGGTATRS